MAQGQDYICKAIIDAHDGSIRVENNTDEKGATFSFGLPLRDQTSFDRRNTPQYSIFDIKDDRSDNSLFTSLVYEHK